MMVLILISIIPVIVIIVVIARAVFPNMMLSRREMAASGLGIRSVSDESVGAKPTATIACRSRGNLGGPKEWGS